ncbi:MAG: ABC transporter ATP-binding protein [Candidatus Hodarchaeales archaeon]|jgi:putative ABC transport system ATP-binding protein
MSLVSISGLIKYYSSPSGDLQVLKGIDLDVGAGEFIAVMGPSGSGKTTLLNIIAAIDTPTSGSVKIDGQELAGRKEKDLVSWRRELASIVFQSNNLVPYMSALDNVMVPQLLALKEEYLSQQRALELLEAVGLEDRADHLPEELSQGEQQRVGIARGLANNPLVLLADEPTGNLDTKKGLEIMEIFKELTQEQGKTVIMVTHNARLSHQADKVYILRMGKIYMEKIIGTSVELSN